MDKVKINSNQIKLIAQIAIPLIIAVLSFTVIAAKTSSVDTHRKTIENLDNKQEIVLGLSASSAALATGASLILKERVEPISNKLLDLTGYFLFILSAIILEKYLVTILGFAAFKIVIPLACILFIIFTLLKNQAYKKLAIKIALFAIIIYLVIPASVAVSDFIENQYKTNLNTLISDVDNLKKELNEYENKSKEVRAEIYKEESKQIVNGKSDKEDEEKSWLEKAGDGIAEIVGNVAGVTKGAADIVGNVVSDPKDAINKMVENITGIAKGLIDKITDSLNKFVEAIAILLVTTCLIPILILIFFLWLITVFFSVKIELKDSKGPSFSSFLKKDK